MIFVLFLKIPLYGGVFWAETWHHIRYSYNQPLELDLNLNLNPLQLLGV